MSKETINMLGQSVGLAVALDPKGCIKLLNNFGVNVNKTTPSEVLSRELIDKLTSDPSFLKPFQSLIGLNAKVAKQAGVKGFNGSYNADGSFDWGGAVTGLLGAGSSIFTSIKNSDAQKKLAEKQAEIARLNAESSIAQGNQAIELEKLRLAQIQAQNAGGSSPNKMLVYGGVGLGVLMLVGLTVVLIKK